MDNHWWSAPLTIHALCFSAIVVYRLEYTDGNYNAYNVHNKQVQRDRPLMQYKWLINTGNFAGRWPPQNTSHHTGQNNSTTATPCTSVSPNTITRLQMIHGGTTAVFVMPTGDGGNRCLGSGMRPQFSLGYINLQHGKNNLFPTLKPFPHWKAFMETEPHDQSIQSAVEDDLSTETPKHNVTPTKPRTDPNYGSHHKSHHYGQSSQRIVNAVDTFLDNKGRLLWVLDTGLAGEDACYGNTRPGDASTNIPNTDPNDQSPPRVLAIDVHTNQIVNVISLSKVWQPGVSCFQYVTAVYLKAYDMKPNVPTGPSQPTRPPNSGSPGWPLVVVGDAGRNRLHVYSYTVDMFSEIMLPLEEYKNTMDDYDSYDINGSGESKEDVRAPPTTTPKHRHKHHHRWENAPRIRDILYMVPLSPRPGQSILLVTYHGCRDLYKLRLQPSSSVDISYQAGVTGSNATVTTPADAPHLSAPVTGTLTIIGWKPCLMVVLGTDRRKLDANDDSFPTGGTTVFFRLENTNDIWSWNTAHTRKKSGGRANLFIDEHDFRLVRLGRTCRVPVAVSMAPVVSDHDEPKNEHLVTTSKPYGSKVKTMSSIQQIAWMLESNFVDHFAGTTDNMGANAKLQPIETPLYSSSEDNQDHGNAHGTWQPSSLRVQQAPNCRRTTIKS